MKAEEKKIFGLCSLTKRKNLWERFVSEFMFVPIFVIVLWLTVFVVHCLCVYCYDENATVYVCEVPQDNAVECISDETNVSTDAGSVKIDGKININSATASQFEELEGIGPVKAQNIIETRQRMGGFRTIDDLLNVSGVGEKILENIRGCLVIE